MGIQERKEREKEHRKEEILDAAQKIFFEKGLSVATMDEIAEAAELSKGTLYLYYKSKEDLYLAVATRGFHFLHKEFEKIINEEKSVIKALVLFSDAYINFFHIHRNYFRMFNFLQSPHFHKQVSEEMRMTCNEEAYKSWEKIINIIKKGMDNGLVRDDLDPTEITIIFWSNITALLLRHDNEGEIWKERMKIDLMHALSVSIKLLFNGILTEKGRAEYISLKHKI